MSAPALINVSMNPDEYALFLKLKNQQSRSKPSKKVVKSKSKSKVLPKKTKSKRTAKSAASKRLEWAKPELTPEMERFIEMIENDPTRLENQRQIDEEVRLRDEADEKRMVRARELHAAYPSRVFIPGCPCHACVTEDWLARHC